MAGKPAYAEHGVSQTDAGALLEEYHAKTIKRIGNKADLLNYMYESFLLGKGVVIEYTGGGEVTLEDVDRYLTEVIQIDRPTLRDCEALWGNIDGYAKAVLQKKEHPLICISPVYRHTEAEMRQLDKITDMLADRLDQGGGRREKIRAVHDYIVETFDYDESLKNYDDYDGFFQPVGGQKKMVCQGYSLLAYRLLNRMDIPCKIIMSESHSWNIVQLEDGLWYHLDCTNDDKGSAQNTYDNFLKTDDHLEGGIYQYLPSCVLYDNLDGYVFAGSEKKAGKAPIKAPAAAAGALAALLWAVRLQKKRLFHKKREKERFFYLYNKSYSK